MVVIAINGTLPKAKGIKVGTLFLIMNFLLGIVAAIDLDLTSRLESANMTEIDWDPEDPPLWTIRPDDRDMFLANKAAGMSVADSGGGDQGGNPCENRNGPARLYHMYYEENCPAPLKFDNSGTDLQGVCEKWNVADNQLECASFCQVRTVFEWAEERPYPHSDCHAPVHCSISQSDSTSVGWSVSVSPKVGKALKVGISGSHSHSHGESSGRSFSVSLNQTSDLRCGYFTFVAVKKITCGYLSEAVPGVKYYVDGVDPDPTHTSYCATYEGPMRNGSHSAKITPDFCTPELWKVKDRHGKLVPDGVTIFVYTDCDTRAPLRMDYQDEVYRHPGVALSHNTIRALHDSWIRSTCYLADMRVTENGKKYKSIYMTGLGFSDNQIGGRNGDGLFEGIRACANGDLINTKFTWFNSGYPGDSAEIRGAAWLLEGDVPMEVDGGCIGQALMKAGGNSVGSCTDGS